MMQFQLLVDQPANVTGLRAGIESVYPFGHSTYPLALVIQKPTKHSPATITNRLSQVMVLEHPTHIQILNLDVSKLIDDSTAGLMQKVFALVGYLFVLASHKQACFLSTLASLLASAQLALQSLKSLLGLSQILRVVNLLAGTKYGKMLKPQVNSNSTRILSGFPNITKHGQVVGHLLGVATMVAIKAAQVITGLGRFSPHQLLAYFQVDVM